MKNLFTLFFILAIYSINAQINATINLETKSPEITIMTGGDNISYSLVTLPNESGYAPEGKPLLPIKFYTFIIPADKDLSNLNVVYGTSSQTILSNRVYPGQKDVSDPNLTTPFVVPDEAVYQSSSIYPTQSAFVSNISWYGVNKLVTVGIYLCRYYPTQNKFLNYSSVQFSASFISVQKPADMFCKRPTKVWSDEIAYLKTKVINSDKVEEYYAYNNSIAAIPLKSGNDVDYIIVCPDNLCSAFNEFLLWKRCKGLLAEIVPLSQIYSSQTGDEISGIYDNAGKVRQYLRTRCSENGLQYVLLIGDMSNGAIRISNGEFGTDYYFAELNGNWDANKNGIYGDDNDNVDLIPEISVGRLLATTKEEVANWINKTFIYEQNPGLGDASYLNSCSLRTQYNN